MGITASGAPGLQGDLGHATLSAVIQFPGCKMGKSEPWEAGGEEKGTFSSWGVEGAACCPRGASRGTKPVPAPAQAKAAIPTSEMATGETGS